jgi:tetratricopeptide (TPR) repeat protein
MQKYGFLLVCFWMGFLLPGLAAENPFCPEASSLDYGMQRYGEKKWDLAALGLDRFLFFCPGHGDRDRARIYLALAYRNLGKKEEAALLLRSVHREGQGTEAPASALLLASFYAEDGEPGQAVLWAENVARTTEEADLKAAALWIAGGQYLKAGDFQGAALRWEHLPEKERLEAEKLWEAWGQKPEAGKKSVFAAGFWGLIPGGGYVYAGRRQAGAMAFGLTLGMGAAAWEAFDQDLPILGTLLGLITLGFYGGSMKGGMEEVRLGNRNLDLNHEAEVTQRFRKEASLPLDGGSIRILVPF